MRFDAARALAEAQNFAFDRLPWAEGGRRVVDKVEDAFREAGYAVERTEVSGSPSARNRRIVVFQLALSGYAVGALVLQGGGGFGHGLAVWMIAVILLFFLPRFLKLQVLEGRPIRTWNVAATRPQALTRPRRVVILTTLDVAPSRSRGCLRGALFILYLGVLFVSLVVGSAPQRMPRRGVVALLATLGVATAASLVAGTRPFPGDHGTDNRDGLGLLIELARTWPFHKDERIETSFVGCGGESLNGAGLRRLEQQIGNEWTMKPTLLIGLAAPGRAPILSIEDSSGRAAKAADDLWIPHGTSFTGGTFAHLLNCENEFDEESELIGLIGVPNSDAPDDIDVEALRRTAQLVHELALRWAKSA